MIDPAKHAQLITAFILEEILDDLDELDAKEDLLVDGMVDSLGMVRLVAFIEDELGIAVPPEDFIVDNFMTVEHITAYLAERAT